MSIELERMSVRQIRQRFVAEGAPVTAQLLVRLQKDRRHGVRQIYQILERQRRARRREQTRIQSLLHFEELLWSSGVAHVAGVDEVGIGPLAGPVVAAAVIFPPHTFIEGIDDSKKLDAGRREELRHQIQACALAYSIGVVDVEEVDRLNVYRAGLEAMRRAIEGLSPQPQHVLVDAREIPDLALPQNRFDKGDGINFSIAAASILAKTHRDALMDRFHAQFPQYGFDRHKGYSTAEHQKALRKYGPCPIHRHSFPFVREACGKFSDNFYRLKAQLDASRSYAALKRAEERISSAQGELAEYELRKLKLCCRRVWSRLPSGKGGNGS